MSEGAYSFLFDLDGVVVDSNTLHVESWVEVARRHGLDLPNPGFIGKCGLRTLAVIRDLLKWPVTEAEAVALGNEKEEIYREWIREGGISPIPGVLEFLERTNAAGHRCAIGSSAPRGNVDLCLEALGIADRFLATVSGEDVKRGKPAPDIYLLAAERVGADPNRCIVLEDAPAGVAAAHAAGIPAVGLLTSHTSDELAAADWLAPDFRGLTPEGLIRQVCRA